MGTHGFIVTAAVFLLSRSSIYAGDKLGLTLVWTRVADVNGEAGSVESAEFSPDGRFVVTGSKFDNQVIMWRTSDGAELWRQTVNEEIERVGWSPDGQWVASVSEDFLLRLFRASDGKLDWTYEHTQGIDALTWSHHGKWLTTGEEEADDGQYKVRVFEMPKKRLLHTVNHTGDVNCVHYSPDDQYLLSAGGTEVRIWRTSNMSLVQTLEGRTGYTLVTARFSPDGELIAASGNGGYVYVWRWEEGSLLKGFNQTGKKIEVVEWTPDGQYLLTAGHDPYIRLIRRADLSIKPKEIPVAHMAYAMDNAEYMHFNADGSMLVSAHQDGMVRLWVFMSEDPTVSQRRHEEVKKRQKAAAKSRKK